MDFIKILNISGILLQLVGVLLVANSDLLAKAIAAAYDRIPGSPLVELYGAAKAGELRFASKEERDYRALARRADGRKALWSFRVSLLLIILGMVAQLIAVIAGK